jgi:hypothetical protein
MVVRCPAGDQRLDQFRPLLRQGHVTAFAALADADGERADITVVVCHLESAELAIAAAGEQGRVS